MIMYHSVFSSFYCSLLVSLYLFLLSYLSMQNLKIGSLNINGGRDRQKRALISEVATQKRINVLFLQETHSNLQALHFPESEFQINSQQHKSSWLH